jgi:hypothetical protein
MRWESRNSGASQSIKGLSALANIIHISLVWRNANNALDARTAKGCAKTGIFPATRPHCTC